MEFRYKKEYAESLVSSYIEDIEKQKLAIRRNFKEMDLENCKVRDDFETIINNLITKCDRLISEIKSLSNFE